MEQFSDSVSPGILTFTQVRWNQQANHGAHGLLKRKQCPTYAKIPKRKQGLLLILKSIESMKTYILPLAAVLAISFASALQAAPVVINSPNHGETLSESSILSQGLHWDARRQRLTAIITFSNENYASDSTQRHDDTLAFALPGVRYDQAENVFYVISKNGERTPIAKFSPMLFGKVIQLLPGATVYVEKSYGNISIKLVKTQPNGAPHWKEVALAPIQT
jgi:hypothetical protein